MKNVTAEEKHYIKKNTRLSQELNKQNSDLVLFTEEIVKLKKEIAEQNKKILALETENELLRKNSSLTNEEIKQMLKSQRSVETFISLMSLMKDGGYGNV